MPLKQWYDQGLYFKCTGCGQCCTGAPGYVWLLEEDIAAFTEKLQIDRATFLKTYCRQVHGRYSLIEDPKTYDCIFFKNKQCTAYEARPKQCRTFPFWKQNIVSKSAWRACGKECEGIDHPEGKLYTADEIDAHL